MIEQLRRALELLDEVEDIALSLSIDDYGDVEQLLRNLRREFMLPLKHLERDTMAAWVAGAGLLSEPINFILPENESTQ